MWELQRGQHKGWREQGCRVLQQCSHQPCTHGCRPRQDVLPEWQEPELPMRRPPKQQAGWHMLPHRLCQGWKIHTSRRQSCKFSRVQQRWQGIRRGRHCPAKRRQGQARQSAQHMVRLGLPLVAHASLTGAGVGAGGSGCGRCAARVACALGCALPVSLPAILPAISTRSSGRLCTLSSPPRTRRSLCPRHSWHQLRGPALSRQHWPIVAANPSVRALTARLAAPAAAYRAALHLQYCRQALAGSTAATAWSALRSFRD